ncbi:MAG: hypothetical protein OXN17_07565 [Candidatus Poribacteria bacterium]|nr:hypothetical protein [Candidatus Poribacteria bacterium]MDE0503690.1 hypothetical protein [Candidatus Poribacteria bacterium]
MANTRGTRIDGLSNRLGAVANRDIHVNSRGFPQTVLENMGI